MGWAAALALLAAAHCDSAALGQLLLEDAGCALAFRGNQEVQLLREGGTVFNFSGAFTLESWAQVAEDRSNFYGSGPNEEMCIQGFGDGGPRLSVTFSTAAGPARPLGSYAFLGPGDVALCEASVPDAGWHHVAATWDGATARVSVDGGEACSRALDPSSWSPATTSSFSVGALPGHRSCFKGLLDEVRAWRSVRSAAEIAAWMRRHLDAAQQSTELEVDLRFDECTGDRALNSAPSTAGQPARGSLGVLVGGVASVSSAPSWVASRARIYGAAGSSRAEIRPSGGGAAAASHWDLPLTAWDASLGALASPLAISLTGTLSTDGGISVTATGQGLRVTPAPVPSLPKTGGGEQLLRQNLLLGQQTVRYRIDNGAQRAEGTLSVALIGNRPPTVGEAGRSLSFPQGTYAGSLDFVLRHRGTPGMSGANHSALLTIEFWSRNSLTSLQEAGSAGTAAMTLGNSEDDVEAWSPATCRKDGGCAGRGSVHLPWSSGYPWTFFHYGITHLPMSAQLPCPWAHHSGEWQHVAFVADPDRAFHGIYFNGELCNPGSQVDGPSADLRTFFLGVWPLIRGSADTVHHTGEVDELRIWQTARTAQEIRSGMFRPASDAEIASGDLLASWSFDDCGMVGSTKCRDASGNGNHLLFAVCGLFQDDSLWDGFIGPSGPKGKACHNLTHPEEVDRSSWPARHASKAPISGPFMPLKPRSLEEERSRVLEDVVITAFDPDADDRLVLEFLEVPAVGTFSLGGLALATGSLVPMQPLRPLVHGVTLRLENLAQGVGAIGRLRFRARDGHGAFSPEGSINVHAHMAGPGQEFVERLGRVQPCAQGYYANGTGGPCQKCPSGKYGPLPHSWMDSVGNAECLPCREGTFGFESGLSHCAECEVGRFSEAPGRTTCANCPQGTFADGQGSSFCKACLMGTNTSMPGAALASDCACPAGQFVPCADGAQPLSRTGCDIEQPTTKSCRKCPEGFTCPGGAAACPARQLNCPAGRIHAQPLLKPGFYSNRASPYEAFFCWNSPACPGQRDLADPICAPKHQGLNCGRCQDGHYLSTSPGRSVCETCDPALLFLTAFLVLAVWLLFGLGLWLQERMGLFRHDREAAGPQDASLAAAMEHRAPNVSVVPPQQAAVSEMDPSISSPLATPPPRPSLDGTPSVDAQRSSGQASSVMMGQQSSGISHVNTSTSQDARGGSSQPTAQQAAAPAPQAQRVEESPAAAGALGVEETHVASQNDMTPVAFLGGCLGQAVGFLQKLSILEMLSFDWPSTLQSLLRFVASIFLDLSMGSVNANCILGPGFEAQYLGHLVAPACVWLLGGLWYLVNIATGKKYRALSAVRILNALGLFMMVFYTLIAVNMVTLLDCYSNPNGYRTLRRYPFVVCGDMTQLQMVPPFILAFLFYVGGFLSVCVYIVLEAPVRFTDPQFRAAASFLTFKYNPSTYWYGVVVALRSLCLSVVTVVTPHSMLAQFWFLTATVFLSLVMQLAFRPLRSRWAHLLEVAEQTMLLTVLALGLAFNGSSEHALPALAGLILFGIFGYVCLVVLCALYMAVNYWRPQLELQARSEVLDIQQIAAQLVLLEPAATQKVLAQAVSRDLSIVRDVSGFWMLECAGLQQPGCLQRRLPLTATTLVAFDQSRLEELQAVVCTGKLREAWKP